MGGVNKDTERGPQTMGYNLRSEVGKFEWRGMWPDGDSASIPENRFRILKNARLESGAVVARPGQTKLNTSAIHNAGADIVSIQDFQMATPYQLFCDGDGCPGAGVVGGAFIGSYDIDQNPQAQGLVYYPSATHDTVFTVFDGAIHIGVENQLRRYQQVRAPWGSSVLSVAGNVLDKPLVNLPAGFTHMACLEAFDGKLFLGCVQGVGNSKVAVWDGVTLADDLSAVNAPVGFALYRDNLIVYLDGVNSLRSRPIGAPGATWATIAPAAGTVRMRGHQCAASYKDILYFCVGGGAGSDDLWQYNGTTLSRIPVATWGGPAGCITHSCCVFNGFLYVSYYSATHAGLAKFDGTTWTGVEKSFKAQFALCQFAGPIAEFQGNLIAGVQINSLAYLLKSPGTTTSGTWTQLAWGAGSPAGVIGHIKVY